MAGIVSYGVYVPYHRLERKAIAAALGTPAGRGTRAVASYDEDTTSMGVEAARPALAAAPPGVRPASVYFATTDPPYLDKTNANAIHAALALDSSAIAVDMVGSSRSAVGAMKAASDAAGPALAVLSDRRTGLPQSAEEREGGDAAAAFLWGGTGADPAAVIAEVVGSASATDEFLDRWRVPGQPYSRQWEERFGEQIYVPLAHQAFADALKAVGITPDQVDHVVVAGPHQRAVRRIATSLGTQPEALVPDLTDVVGQTGAAHAGLLLAAALDRAEPGQVVAVVSVSDGADVLVLRATDALAAYRSERARTTVAAQVESGRTGLPYPQFLTWRGFLDREPPRRPDPTPPAAPPSHRNERWKYAFTASRCTACGTRHLPPQRVCASCHAVDQLEDERLSDVEGTIATFTIDRLAFSLSPPVVAAVVNFDGGGRYTCELTDVDPDQVAIGNRVEMTFRRLFTAQGVHNYFWKGRPVRGGV